VLSIPSYAEWANVQGWEIDTHSGGCSLAAKFKGGIHFIIRLDGRSSDDMDMDIMIGNEDWKSIRVGKDYEVRMDFNRGADWNVTFTGKSTDDGNKFLLNYDDAYSEDSGDFAQDFMRSESVYISFEGTPIDNLDLSGSKEAFNEMVKCQRSFINSSQDPFSRSDPFR
jgi:hypothetical protein